MDRDRLSELMASPDLSLAFDTPIFKAIAGQLPKCMEMSSATQCSNKLAEHLVRLFKALEISRAPSSHGPS